MDFSPQIQQIKRATVGRSVLGWVALTCLLLNAAFWATLMLNLLAPPSLISPQSLQAALSTAAFALILPLFWSMLLPSSPAGRLLQKQTWALPGHLAVTVAATFLTWLAGTWLRAWWQAQPNVADANADLLLTISSIIAGVLLPALAWCVMTPEQFIAVLEQARYVKRIEHAIKMEEAAMRAQYARAVSLLNADLTSLTLGQRRELAGILGGFARMQQHAMRQIAVSWKDMYGVECQLATIPDSQLLEGYKNVAAMLAEGADGAAVAANYAAELLPPSRLVDQAGDPPTTHAAQSHIAHQDREMVDHERVHGGPRWPTVAQHNRPVVDQGGLDTARRALSGAWSRNDLQRALSISKTQALNYISAWAQSGELVRLTDPADRYEWS